MAKLNQARRDLIAITPSSRIAELVTQHGSYRAAAEKIGIDHVYLHRVAKGQKEASANLLALLGLELRLKYVRI